jgi:hypothetical protein
MASCPQGSAPWPRERHVTDAMEGLALLARAVAAAARVTLADIEPRVAPVSAGLRRSGPDQRWRRARRAVAVEVYAGGVGVSV